MSEKKKEENYFIPKGFCGEQNCASMIIDTYVLLIYIFNTIFINILPCEKWASIRENRTKETKRTAANFISFLSDVAG